MQYSILYTIIIFKDPRNNISKVSMIASENNLIEPSLAFMQMEL